MTREISDGELQNPRDRAFQLRMMTETIAAVRSHGKLFMPLLNLVSTFIDGLAAGPSGQEKSAYLTYLKAHFPDLCQELGAEVFYSKFRNSAVHEFSIKPGFAIDEATVMGDKYVEAAKGKNPGQSLIVLNIDRLVDDFQRHLAALAAKDSAI